MLTLVAQTVWWLVFWTAVLVLTAAAAAVSYHLTGPPPPKKIRLATGERGGAYYQQDVYRWRLHVAMVQDEAHKRLEEQPGSQAISSQNADDVNTKATKTTKE